MQSSMTPPSSFVIIVSEPIPSGRAFRSAQHIFSMKATRSAPRRTTPSMCDTSKRPAFALQAPRSTLSAAHARQWRSEGVRGVARSPA
eukprot:2617302-Prymnesium_polylepis.1